ncbi:MAG: phosphatidylserine decarboxylase [Bacteroidota bacterium]
MEIKYIDRATGEIQTENPPAVGLLNFLYSNPLGKKALLPLVKQKFISEIYGKQMDKAASTGKIQDFVEELDIDMTESQKSISDFSSFNDFFYRKLKPEARPIAEGFVAPGDGRFLAFERISDLQYFFVKGEAFTLTAFLDDATLAEKYQDAALLILRLAPNDYHRFHFPYDGIPSPINKIKGSYYSVSPYAVARNFVRVFCQNKREFCLLETKKIGTVLIAPVGATMVGSIIETYSPNKAIQKGDEMGYFAFGGSSIVLLVDKNKLRIDADLIKNTRNGMETFVKMGEQIGQPL